MTDKRPGGGSYGQAARDEAGLTATLTDGREVLVLVVRPCSSREAVEAVCAACDTLGLYVVSLSTPRTILADLRGRRSNSWRHSAGSTTVMKPEPQLLGAAGRVDLLWQGAA